MIRTALYARVSSDKQVQEGDSIPAQLSALRKYIDDHSDMLCVGEYIDDGISGTKSDRDELQRLLADVQADKIDLIVFCKLDRWFRSVRHYTATQEILDKHHVEWKAIWESYETETPGGRFIINTMMAIAQLEAENTGSRVRQVFDYKVSQGEAISGSVPAGYHIEGKHLVISDTADSVRFAFEEYARCGSLRQTMRACADLPGLPTAFGTFRTMLKNRMYIGEYRGNPNYCPAVIDRALFDEVQVNLNRNVKNAQKHPYLFTGLLRCDVCGGRMEGNQRKYRGKAVLVYRCHKHIDHRYACPNCKVLQENVLERELLARMRPELEGIVFDLEQKKKEVKKQKTDAAKIQKKLDRLKDLYLNELISLEEYRRDRETLEKALETPGDPPDASKVKELLSTDFEGLYSGFTALQRRRFWRLVIREIRWTMDREVIVDWL